ncbi:MAG: PilZ domain-containing protein [Polyangiaceae bacterium]|nr:PilZ domain-containing protein [Polyangiaceae bacterium]
MSDSRPPQAAQRRHVGGARRATSERVTLCREEAEVEGWSLNVSRGGLRVVIEGQLNEGDLVDVQAGDANTPSRPARIAWVKSAPGGQVVGLQFLDTAGSIPPADDPT